MIVLEWFVAVLLAFAAVQKLRLPGQIEETSLAFGLPVGLAKQTRWLVPLAEALVVVLILWPGQAVLGLAGALLLLTGFTIMVAVNLIAGNRPACNCFGSVSNKPIGISTIVRNGVLLVLTGGALAFRAGPPMTAVAIMAGATILVIGLVLLTAFLVHSEAEQRQMLSRIQALEDSALAARSVGNNSLPPRGNKLMLENLSGTDSSGVQRHVLDELRAPTDAVVVLMEHCGPCQEILAGPIMRWQNRLEQSAYRFMTVIAGETVPDGVKGWITDLQKVHASGLLGTPALVWRPKDSDEPKAVYGQPEIERTLDEWLLRPRPPATEFFQH